MIAENLIFKGESVRQLSANEKSSVLGIATRFEEDINALDMGICIYTRVFDRGAFN